MAGIPIHSSSPIRSPSDIESETRSSMATSTQQQSAARWTTLPPRRSTSIASPSSRPSSPSWSTTSATPPLTPPSIKDIESSPPTPSSRVQARYMPPDALSSPQTSGGNNGNGVDWTLPQPSAIPRDLTVHTHRRYANKSLSSLPPPPKKGEKFVPPPSSSLGHRRASSGFSAPLPHQHFQQQQLLSPSPLGSPRTGGYGPTGGLLTGDPVSQHQSISVGHWRKGHARAHSLEHPPGYLQDPNASEMSADQWRKLQALKEEENSPQRMPFNPNDLSLPGGSSFSTVDADSVWNTAKKWAQSAGGKLLEVEAEVWKRVSRE